MWTLFAALAAPVPSLPDTVDLIAFGSCAYSRMPNQRSWTSIVDDEPDAMVLLGDNVYGNTEDPEVLRRTLRRLGRRPRFRKLRHRVPLFHTWDDHDYGLNDSDARHPNKEQIRQVTLDFFGAAAGDQRRDQPGGIYTQRVLGQPGRQVQLIILDTRWDLSPRQPRTDGGVGRYAPGEGQILGPAQWAWLERSMARPADLRIVVSSIPFAPSHNGWETWANFPDEQQRLVTLLKAAGPVLVVSGDVHYAELSVLDGIVDFTTSGLAGHAYALQENSNRLDDLGYSGNNYGTVGIDWEASVVDVVLHDKKGQTVFERRFGFDELDP